MLTQAANNSQLLRNIKRRSDNVTEQDTISEKYLKLSFTLHRRLSKKPPRQSSIAVSLRQKYIRKANNCNNIRRNAIPKHTSTDVGPNTRNALGSRPFRPSPSPPLNEPLILSSLIHIRSAVSEVRHATDRRTLRAKNEKIGHSTPRSKCAVNPLK
jgi:hypothetical protein